MPARRFPPPWPVAYAHAMRCEEGRQSDAELLGLPPLSDAPSVEESTDSADGAINERACAPLRG
jgi:hypothetical protein